MIRKRRRFPAPVSQCRDPPAARRNPFRWSVAMVRRERRLQHCESGTTIRRQWDNEISERPNAQSRLQAARCHSPTPAAPHFAASSQLKRNPSPQLRHEVTTKGRKRGLAPSSTPWTRFLPQTVHPKLLQQLRLWPLQLDATVCRQL